MPRMAACSLARSVRTFRTRRWLRLLVGASTAFVLLFDAAVVAGIVFEPEERGIYAAGIVMAFMTLLASVVAVRTFRRAELHADRIVFGLVRLREVPLASIREVIHRDGVVLTTKAERYTIRFGDRDAQAALVAALRDRLPEGGRAKRIELPFSWRPRRSVVLTNIILSGLFGPGIFALGVASVLSGEITAMIMGVLFLAMGALFTWMLLFKFRMRVDFGEGEIVEIALLRRRRFRAESIAAVDVTSETRTYRGISRTAWVLTLRFDDDRELKIEPTEDGIAPEFSPDSDRAELGELAATLRRLYL